MAISSTDPIFEVELSWVKNYFEKWSHCERAIGICSLLKQFQYPTLRFIHTKIESTINQSSDCEKNKILEQKSNNRSHITELCDSYKSLTNNTTISDVQLNNNNKDSIYFESDKLIIGDHSTVTTATTTTTNSISDSLSSSSSSSTKSNIDNFSNNTNGLTTSNTTNSSATATSSPTIKPLKSNANHNSNSNLVISEKSHSHSTKEDILKEILDCILMLKCGNDDVIQEYLALIPFLVDDTHRRIINVEAVMQTLSILVAHPALSSEDLRTVKEHIERLIRIINVQNGQYLNSDWQAIAPPYVFKSASNTIFSSLSSVGSSQMQNDNLYDTQSDYIETDTGSAGRSSGGGSDFFIPNLTSLSATTGTSNANQRRSQTTQDDHYGFLSSGGGVGGPTNDDQNISFSKNGTEIPDFNPDIEQTNTQFQHYFDLTLNSIIDNAPLKTRRSNSLTIGGIKHNEQLLASVLTSSNENLSHMMHKPRSFSLSIENPRLLMTASGSETRLDDLKPTYQTFQSQHPGMKYVGAWLKRLRLHKYAYIFENFTFEQMMEITDEFLEKLTVTQGARTKLVNSIQKLKERHTKLTQTELDLKNGKITINQAIEVLTDVVATPMKPIEKYNPTDVAAQFLNLLGLVCKIMISKQIGPQDEEPVNQLVRIFDIAQLENNEPFVAHTYQLKELRYRIETIRMEFPPKNHYHKGGNGTGTGNSNKARWASSTKSHNKNGNDIKPHRKNSNPMSNFNFVTMQQAQKQQKQSHSNGNNGIGSKSKKSYLTNNNYHTTPPTSNYNKSSSYPNFSSNSSGGSSTGSINSQQYINLNGQTVTTPHHSYHRHSVSNLITITPSKTTASIVTPNASISSQQQQQQQHQKTSNSNCIGLHSSQNNKTSTKNTTPITSSTILPQINYCSLDTPVSSIGRSSSTGSSSYSKQHSLGDISPYRDLEFLSLQMTEQAIN